MKEDNKTFLREMFLTAGVMFGIGTLYLIMLHFLPMVNPLSCAGKLRAVFSPYIVIAGGMLTVVLRRKRFK